MLLNDYRLKMNNMFRINRLSCTGIWHGIQTCHGRARNAFIIGAFVALWAVRIVSALFAFVTKHFPNKMRVRGAGNAAGARISTVAENARFASRAMFETRTFGDGAFEP